MPPATDAERAALAPFIAGERPDERGEIDMYCPLHNDSRRSASLNLTKGVWCCHAGCGGGSVRRLVESADCWVPAEGRVTEARPSAVALRTHDVPKPVQVKRWHRHFMNDELARNELFEQRGITAATAHRARIGWTGRYYKIPVFSPMGELWNVRTYDMHVTGDRRKIWSVRGMGRARLYPAGILEMTRPGDTLILCEGEWDALLAIQAGYFAVTRTDGAGKPWHHEWDVGFAGLRLFMCHDRDTMGEKSNRVTAAALEHVVEELHTIRLPFQMREKNGKDLTDYLLDQDDHQLALGELMASAD